ncbi:MAG TPA: hypothetical protein VFV03_00315 [Solirubrobacteraceae bacterium]|nr:hypothetical protein [Solirubrobacteraceae bacterium]
MNNSPIAVDEPVVAHINLICMCCGHIQPVSREQIPSRCEHCREAFNTHGYLLDEDTAAAEEHSQEVLDTRAAARVGASA